MGLAVAGLMVLGSATYSLVALVFMCWVPSLSSPKIMPTRLLWTLMFLYTYAVVITISCPYLFVHNISKHLTMKACNEMSFYKIHFMPEQSSQTKAGGKKGKAKKQQ